MKSLFELAANVFKTAPADCESLYAI